MKTYYYMPYKCNDGWRWMIYFQRYTDGALTVHERSQRVFRDEESALEDLTLDNRLQAIEQRGHICLRTTQEAMA